MEFIFKALVNLNSIFSTKHFLYHLQPSRTCNLDLSVYKNLKCLEALKISNTCTKWEPKPLLEDNLKECNDICKWYRPSTSSSVPYTPIQGTFPFLHDYRICKHTSTVHIPTDSCQILKNKLRK